MNAPDPPEGADRAAAEVDEAPPLLSWPQLHALVLVALAASIAALAWLTQAFR